MTAIPAIDPAASIDIVSRSLGPTSPSGPSQGPDMAELTQRFKALMAQPASQDLKTQAPEQPNQSLLTHMMSSGEEFMQQTHEQIAALRDMAPTMSAQEFAAASIQVSEAASIGSFRLQAATSIASGTNKSLQALFKNQ